MVLALFNVVLLAGDVDCLFRLDDRCMCVDLSSLPSETPCSLCCWLLMLLDLWWSHLPWNQLVCVSWGVKVEWSWWWWPTSLLSGCGWGEKSTCSSAGKSEQEWLHICAYTSLTHKLIHTKSQIHIPSTVPSSFRVNELWGSKGWPVRHNTSGDAQSLVSVMTSDMASHGITGPISWDIEFVLSTSPIQ